MRDIRAALWQYPADMELVRTLISKRMGLRICAGQRAINLKPAAKLYLLSS